MDDNMKDKEELEEKRKAAHREAQKRYRERKKNGDVDSGREGDGFNKYKYDKNYLKDKYSQISVRIPIEFRNKVDEHIKRTGEPITQFIKRAINDTIERDSK